MQRVTVSTKETPAATAATSWSPLLNRNARLIQRKCACGDTPGSTGECEECSKNKRLALQTKLKVNEPGDIYEQEAACPQNRERGSSWLLISVTN